MDRNIYENDTGYLRGRLTSLACARSACDFFSLPATLPQGWPPLEMEGFAIPRFVKEAQPLVLDQCCAVIEDAYVISGISPKFGSRFGEVIDDSLYHNFDALNIAWYRNHGIDIKAVDNVDCFFDLSIPVKKFEAAISLFSWENRNYAHWLFERLPICVQLLNYKQFSGLPILVEDDLPDSIIESIIKFWPRERIFFFPRGALVEVGRLVCISDPAQIWEPESGYIYNGLDFRIAPPAYRLVREHVVSNESTIYSGRRRVYLIRPPSGNGRTVINQDELVAALADTGFDILSPGEMKFNDQVKQFSSIDLVVSATGAALANMLWMKPGTTVIVLAPDCRELFYWFWHSVASALGIRLVYFSTLARSVPLLPRFHWDFSVDVQALLLWLKKSGFLAEIESLQGMSSVDHDRSDALSMSGALNMGWEAQRWLLDRRPSQGRECLIRNILRERDKLDSGGLGAVVVSTLDDGALLAQTLDSLRQQRRAFDVVWVLAGENARDAQQPGIHMLRGGDPWFARLSELASHPDIPDFLWVIHEGDQLVPHATLTLEEYRIRQPDAKVWYADEATRVGDQARRLVLKPDFNLDLLRCTPYVGRNLILNTGVIRALDGLYSQAADLAPVGLLWQTYERYGATAIGHVPEVLHDGTTDLASWARQALVLDNYAAIVRAHLVRSGTQAQLVSDAAGGVLRVAHRCGNKPFVSIVIATRNFKRAWTGCVQELLAATAYVDYELLLIGQGSMGATAILDSTDFGDLGTNRIRVLNWTEPYEQALMYDFAVRQAAGEVLLFLDEDIRFPLDARADWLERLVAQVLRPEVGLAGVRLDLPEGHGIAYCGHILGLDGAVGRCFYGHSADDSGDLNRLRAQQDVGALSAVCLMVQRAIFDELGGFDIQTFPALYADTDLCLKATQAGYLLVLEPQTGLVYGESFDDRPGLASNINLHQGKAHLQRLYERWLPQLSRDPNYHPAFARQAPGFNVSLAASRLYEPLPGRPVPVVLSVHLNWRGGSHYRILNPSRALEDHGLLERGLGLGSLDLLDVARVQPDVVVLQGIWLNFDLMDWVERCRRFTKAKIVLEFDDYWPDLPTGNRQRKMSFPGLITSLHRLMDHVDWLVVSTPRLADIYRQYHQDVRVAHSGVLPADWSGVAQGFRQVGARPRVGWACSTNYGVDLSLLRSVIATLSREVEWVFLGDKPLDIPGEHHPAVEISRYPALLASLNLDLAVAPMQMNGYNVGKSNINALELGMCGVPVICTDIEPYRDGLPVTLVSNKHEDWVDAIRSHVSDPNALAREGERLRSAVMRDWMLEGDFLEQWKFAWGV